jgi:hypothetical protein
MEQLTGIYMKNVLIKGKLMVNLLRGQVLALQKCEINIFPESIIDKESIVKGKLCNSKGDPLLLLKVQRQWSHQR